MEKRPKMKKTLYIARFCRVFGCQSIENTAKTSVLEQPMPKKAGVMTMTPTGQMTGQVMNPTMDMMEITPKVIGTIGHILLPLRN